MFVRYASGYLCWHILHYYQFFCNVTFFEKTSTFFYQLVVQIQNGMFEIYSYVFGQGNYT